MNRTDTDSRYAGVVFTGSIEDALEQARSAPDYGTHLTPPPRTIAQRLADLSRRQAKLYRHYREVMQLPVSDALKFAEESLP